jgi:hypothetical protein
MAEKQTAEVHTQERQRHPAQPIEATDHEAAPAPFFQGMVANPGALLDTPRLQGRGASPIRVAAMQQMQQIVGNRAVQRFIQRAATAPAPPVSENLAQRIQMASGRGHSLDTAVQRQLEQGLGADLSDVRVHTDGEADTLARAVDAVAFTSGRDIFFRQGAYNPASSEGQWLLAHEAAHVVQQAAGPVAGTPAPGGIVISHPTDSFEQAANRMADAVVSGHAAGAASGASVSLIVPEVQRLLQCHMVQRCGAIPCNCSTEDRTTHTTEHLLQTTTPSLATSMYSTPQEQPVLQRLAMPAHVTMPWIQRAPPTPPPPTSGFWSIWGAQLDQARRMFQEQRYGCWCGPGNVCTHTVDAIDECCKAHDLAYAAAGVTSDDPPPPGKVNMWTIDGLKRSMRADADLVTCTQATKYDLHFYGPAAALYREGVALIFGLRAAAAAAAAALP